MAPLRQLKHYSIFKIPISVGRPGNKSLQDTFSSPNHPICIQTYQFSIPTYQFCIFCIPTYQFHPAPNPLPMLWEWPRAEIVPLFLNIISLCPDALCSFSNAVSVCFSLQNRSLLPGSPKYSSTALMLSSLLPQLLPQRLIFRFRNRQKFKAGWGRTLKLHLVAAAIAFSEMWAGALFCKSRTPWVNFPLIFFTMSWGSHLSSSA